jgi:hypothetical protein
VRNALLEQKVEFRLTEGRGALVLHDLGAHPRACRGAW